MLKIIFGLLLAVVASTALAGASAKLVCGDGSAGYDMGYGPSQPVTLQITYTTDADAGTPGLFWLGIISPDQTTGAVLTAGQGWITYQGGLYPFQSRYDNGLPGTISLSLQLPNNATSTVGYVGYSVYVGHGAYTPTARQKVADRRIALDSAKPELVARGRWRPEHADDQMYIWSLVQRNMTDSQKYGSVITLPSFSCVRSNH